MRGSHRKIVISYPLSMTINFCTSENKEITRRSHEFLGKFPMNQRRDATENKAGSGLVNWSGQSWLRYRESARYNVDAGDSAGPELAVGTGARRRHAKMAVRQRRGDAAARRTLQVALLDQVGFQHVFDGVALFADGRGQIVEADRAAIEFEQHRFEQLAVHHIETDWINIKHHQCGVGSRLRDLAVALDLGIVPHTAQQSIGDARRAAAALGDFQRTFDD